MSTTDQQQESGAEQPFISHLVELRDRLLHAVIAIAVIFLLLFPFANDIYTYVAEPLMAALPEGNTMIATQVAAPFLTPFKLALMTAVFIAMPYLLFQVWSFVAPGLYRHEKRLAMPLLVSSILLFYFGMAFAYYVVFPLVFAFLSGTTPDGVAMMTDISAYLDFVLTLFFAFGIAFEIPIATILLVSLGVTTPDKLGKKRPYVIVGVFVAGMFLTPPDVISQTLLAIPMWLLFEAGIFASRLILRRRRQSGEQASDEVGLPVAAASAGGAVSSSAPEVPFGFEPTAGGSPPGEGLGTKAGGQMEVGRDVAGGDIDEPGRFKPMTDDEMEAELDAIEAEELIDAPALADSDPVDDKLALVQTLREKEDLAGARRLLYEVLEDGDDDQRRVARNILAQFDT